ncbi:thiol-disulfide oxidoreductase DCC family protein [Kitasatospora camelliae]|uniref:DCC1-like thiol-disulfide oxidoreductase family protein n=1 Tax=Kitasatospora camelliae TaxID=3156397 RepID=A0AAU8JQU2_9ACTN
MTRPALQEPLLLFDGECPLCTDWVARAKRYPGMSRSSGPWEAVAYEFVDLPALNARLGHPGAVCPETVQRSPLWVTQAGRRYSGIDAWAHLLMRSGGPWCYLGGLLALPPVRWLLTIAAAPAARHWHPPRTSGVP